MLNLNTLLSLLPTLLFGFVIWQQRKSLHTLRLKQALSFKELGEARHEKGLILEALAEGVIAIDAEMCISYINATGCKMLGLSKKSLLNKPLSTTEPSALLEKCTRLLEACQTKRLPLTDSITLGASKKIHLDLIAYPKNHSLGAVLILQDTSSHHKVLEMGKDFVANASHELRTPITIVRGFAETLQDIPELPREMVTDITDKIVRNCQRMETLVKNLLTLADIENLPESRFQECDLVALTEACKEVVLALYEEALIEIESPAEPLIVDADPDMLELALINLLDNAAKYSLLPAQIKITFASTDKNILISIQDRGIGIPPTDLEHIFERFYTVDKARSRRLGGTGLGLSLVKTIIEKHEGSIAATSKVGEGTTFNLNIPIHRLIEV